MLILLTKKQRKRNQERTENFNEKNARWKTN